MAKVELMPSYRSLPTKTKRHKSFWTKCHLFTELLPRINNDLYEVYLFKQGRKSIEEDGHPLQAMFSDIVGKVEVNLNLKLSIIYDLLYSRLGMSKTTARWGWECSQRFRNGSDSSVHVNLWLSVARTGMKYWARLINVWTIDESLARHIVLVCKRRDLIPRSDC